MLLVTGRKTPSSPTRSKRQSLASAKGFSRNSRPSSQSRCSSHRTTDRVDAFKAWPFVPRRHSAYSHPSPFVTPPKRDEDYFSHKQCWSHLYQVKEDAAYHVSSAFHFSGDILNCWSKHHWAVKDKPPPRVVIVFSAT